VLAAEFGLRTEEEVAHFVENMAWGCVLRFVFPVTRHLPASLRAYRAGF
jgi:hypothetical protein